MSHETSAAAMIKRFRESRPLSKAEREQEKNKPGGKKELWWIQSEESPSREYESPHPAPQPEVKPSKQTFKSELLDSLRPAPRTSVTPLPTRSKVRDYDDYDDTERNEKENKVNTKLRDSVVDDWIEREIRSLNAELKANSSRNKSPYGNDFPSRSSSRERPRSPPIPSRSYSGAYRYTDPSKSLAPPLNSTLNQSKNSLDGSGSFLLRGSTDTLGSIKGLLDYDLRLDGRRDQKISKQTEDIAKNDNVLETLDINSNLNEVNHELETLLAKLRSEQASLAKPGDLAFFHDANGLTISPDVDVTIPQISNQLQVNMLALQAAFESKSAETALYEESLREEGRIQEREKRILELENITSTTIAAPSQTLPESDKSAKPKEGNSLKPRTLGDILNCGSEAPKSSVPLGWPQRPVTNSPSMQLLHDSFNRRYLPFNEDPVRNLHHGQFESPANVRSDHRHVDEDENDNRIVTGMAKDAMFIQAAMDAEFMAANQIMKAFRSQLNRQLQSANHDMSTINSFPYLRTKIFNNQHDNQLRKEDVHTIPSSISLGTAALSIIDDLDSALNDLSEKFPQHDQPASAPSFPVMDAFYNSIVSKPSAQEIPLSTELVDPLLQQGNHPKTVTFQDSQQKQEVSIERETAENIVSEIIRHSQDSLTFISDDDDGHESHGEPERKTAVSKTNLPKTVTTSSQTDLNHEKISQPDVSPSNRVHQAKFDRDSKAGAAGASLARRPEVNKNSSPILSELDRLDKFLEDDSSAPKYGLDRFIDSNISQMMPAVTPYMPSQRKQYEMEVLRSNQAEVLRRQQAAPVPSAPLLSTVQSVQSKDRSSSLPSFQRQGIGSSKPPDYDIPITIRRGPLEGQAIRGIREARLPQSSRDVIYAPENIPQYERKRSSTSMTPTAPSINASYVEKEDFLRQMQNLRRNLLS